MISPLSVRVLVLRQTSSTLSQSMRQFRRNKVFRREGDGHKGSPPALHLTLSLTLENNKKANTEFPRDQPSAAVTARACARRLRQHALQRARQRHVLRQSNSSFNLAVG